MKRHGIPISIYHKEYTFENNYVISNTSQAPDSGNLISAIVFGITCPWSIKGSVGYLNSWISMMVLSKIDSSFATYGERVGGHHLHLNSAYNLACGIPYTGSAWWLGTYIPQGWEGRSGSNRGCGRVPLGSQFLSCGWIGPWWNIYLLWYIRCGKQQDWLIYQVCYLIRYLWYIILPDRS